MSDDLVKRLRGWAKDIQEGSTAIWAMDQDLQEAATYTSKAKAYDALVKELFVLLDKTEQTDDGRTFRPNMVYSCRAMDADKLERVLKDLKNVLED